MGRSILFGWRGAAVVVTVAVTVMIAGVVGLVVGLASDRLASAQGNAEPPPERMFTPQSSDTEFGLFTVQYAKWQGFASSQRNPQVALVRRGTAADMQALNIPMELQTDPTIPMILIVLRGEFNHEDGRPAGAGYLGYLFDLSTGQQVYRGLSPRGAAFRLALNDLSLPQSDWPDSSQRAGDRLPPEAVRNVPPARDRAPGDRFLPGYPRSLTPRPTPPT
jgi:hypothetical protein